MRVWGWARDTTSTTASSCASTAGRWWQRTSPAIYHRPLELVDDKDLFIESHIQTAEKWEGRMPGFGRDADDWRRRARRAEAEREAARTIAYSTASEADARAQPLERELEALEATASWRLTRPLREINARLARRA